jgi:hypothetical protein
MTTLSFDTVLDIQGSTGLRGSRFIRRLVALWRLHRRNLGRQAAHQQARDEMMNSTRMLEDVGIDSRPQRRSGSWLEAFVRHRV